MHRFAGFLAAVFAALLVVGCGKKSETSQSGTDTSAVATPEPILSAPTLDELKNGTYTGIDTLPAVTLSNGRWEGAPLVVGGASRPALDMVRDFHLVGDLDGDGDEDAVVLLEYATGGTGRLGYVAVVLREGAATRHAAAALLGDRVQVREARVEGNRIVLALVQAGKSDAMCCPGDLVERAWSFSAAGLQEDAPAVTTGRLSLQTLVGKEWVLRSWTFFDAVKSFEPEITLQLEGERVVGSNGCNRYFARVTPGKSPGEVSISALGGTRMICQGVEKAAEERFQQQISNLRRFGFIATQLVLTFEYQGNMEVMLFEGRMPGSE